MKRAAFLSALAMFLLSASPACAQYGDYYYHRVGDTIEWKPNNGYFSWWEFEQFHEDNIKISFLNNNFAASPGGHDSCRILQYFYTPTPLKIIGVAGSVVKKYRQGTGLTDSGEPEYFLIYDADSTDFVLKSRTQWNCLDSHRTVHLLINHGIPDYDGTDDSCCGSITTHYYLPIWEYYFDQPIYVTDSFYVGTTTRNNASGLGVAYTHALIPVTEGISDCGNENIYVSGDGYLCHPVNLTHKGIGWAGRAGIYQTGQWWWAHGPADNFVDPLLIYPIIEVDTTLPPPDFCDSLRNVQVVTTDSTAIVTWDNFPNYSSVFIKYGYGSTATWHTVDVTGNTSYTLTNLEPGHRYGVTMKAECEISKKQTPWTETIYFYTAPDTTTGIEEGPQRPASLLADQTFLQPNPAHNNTTVSSFFNLKRIEILDAHGVLVFSEPVHGHRVTLSLDWLRPGTYIVAIHTHDGTTHKKLIVQ